MKKILALLLALCMVLALAACGNQTAPTATEAPAAEEPATEPTEEPAVEPAAETTEEPAVEPTEEAAVMTYAEFAAAEVDSPVVIKAAVQAHQSWWDNKITVYAADQDGAYFLYNMACSEEDAAKLVPGQWIVVTGFKGEWSGEVEVVDATFELADDEAYVADPVDATAVWGTDDLANYMNQLVTFKGLTVGDKGDGAAFLYKWDGSGEDGDDLYFDVTLGDTTYTFTVESYLCGAGTEVYEAVKNLKVGDVIDLQGFLYWYEGPQAHVTGVMPSIAEAEPVVEHTFMSYAEFAAAQVDDPVTVLAAVQAHQSWWDNKISVYAADPDGAYFIYNMACSEEDAAKLVPGQWILVNGFKGEWSGEVEIVDATFELVDTDALIVEPVDATEVWGTDDMANYMNRLVSFKGLTVGDKGDGAAFLYKWDGSGEDGDDLYFDVTLGDTTYTFTVESYLCGPGTEVYEAVKNLKVGDVIDLEGFLYWYEGPQAHVTAVK